jgi:hypothetical protein
VDISSSPFRCIRSHHARPATALTYDSNRDQYQGHVNGGYPHINQGVSTLCSGIGMPALTGASIQNVHLSSSPGSHVHAVRKTDANSLRFAITASNKAPPFGSASAASRPPSNAHQSAAAVSNGLPKTCIHTYISSGIIRRRKATNDPPFKMIKINTHTNKIHRCKCTYPFGLSDGRRATNDPFFKVIQIYTHTHRQHTYIHTFIHTYVQMYIGD